MAISAEERRLSERTELKYILTIKSEQNQSIFGTVKNISKEGLHIMSLNGDQKGDDIKLVISLPESLQAIYGRSIEITANWRWSHPLNDRANGSFYMVGYEYDLDELEANSRFFIEHALEGIPEQILDIAC